MQVQRRINEYTDEALLAILPRIHSGATLEFGWRRRECAARYFCIGIYFGSFWTQRDDAGLYEERKREIEILRSIGAPSLFIVALLVIESLLVVTLGIVLALAGLIGAILVANNLLASELGIMLSLQVLSPQVL